ncbi:MAG: hypothetical protein AAFV69_14035 [Pseudomonadota bacterium]
MSKLSEQQEPIDIAHLVQVVIDIMDEFEKKKEDKAWDEFTERYGRNLKAIKNS